MKRCLVFAMMLLMMQSNAAWSWTDPNFCDENGSEFLSVDSYDTYSAYDNLHPKFLRRIAYTGDVDRRWGEEDGQPCTNNDKPRRDEMIAHNSVLDGDVKKGSYAATPNAADLQALFDNVARRIKLQLIE